MSDIRVLAIVLLLIVPGCFSDDNPEDEITDEIVVELEACNGAEEYCLRTYDNVTFPETHNAFSTHEDGIFYPASNHETGLTAQWNAGMRAFMLDTHYTSQFANNPSNVAFCHGDDGRGFSPCRYGEVNPWDWLGQMKTFMEASPRDIVTLLVENDVEPDHLKSLFDDVGLSDWMYVHELNTPWPTLLELIDSETRLVVFWEQLADELHPWFHDFNIFSWTTNYAEQETSEMNCEVHRGDGEQPVFHMNSWLSGPLGLSDPDRADQANDPDFLVERGIECIELHGKRPTFIAVDWWEDGDVVEAARRINEIEI
jgi:hypothetical protein